MCLQKFRTALTTAETEFDGYCKTGQLPAPFFTLRCSGLLGRSAALDLVGGTLKLFEL
jgi:hypothetical protein